MNDLTRWIFRPLMVFTIMGLTCAVSLPVMAETGRPLPDVQTGDTTQPEPASGDVKGRGFQQLAPRAGMGIAAPPGTIAPPVMEPTGFKCSPHSGRCNCSGSVDCNYMKDLIKNSCGKFTCTGSGSSQKCTCTINGY